jgi:hypothetical protein
VIKVCAAASVFVKEQKPIGLDGCFISYILHKEGSRSCGKEFVIPLIQTPKYKTFP